MDINSGNQANHEPVANASPAVVDVRRLTKEQLAALGVSHIAYVKPVTIDGTQAYAIHAADGTPMAIMGERDLAFATILQHEMHPLSVH